MRAIFLLLCFWASHLLAVETPNTSSNKQSAGLEHRVALVIGNANYKTSPLANPTNDATDIAAKLKALGFDVTLKTNATQKDMTRAITLFGEKLREGSVGLFYYAGHGIQAKGRNYLIPVDAEIQSEAAVKSEAVDVDQLLEQLYPARVGIVILDACRNNPFERRFRNIQGGGLAQIDAPKGTFIAYATSPGKTAADGDGRNGLYTRELLRAVDYPGLKIEDVFKRVRINVSQTSNDQQIPWESSSLIGDLIFRPNVTVKLSVSNGQSADTSAQGQRTESTLSQLRTDLISPWLVTVQGEDRTRILRISGVAKKSDDTFLLEATYAWTGTKPSAVKAELSQSEQQRKLAIITQSDSTIEVVQNSNGSFTGTITYKTGAVKQVKIERLSDEEAMTKERSARDTQAFANEDKDWGIEPTTSPKTSQYHAPTPKHLPGAKVVRTLELRALLDSDKRAVVIDVLDSKTRKSIPGAFWLPGAGEGQFFSAEKSRFSAALDKLTGGDKSRSLVFLCLSSECWLSYNASLHALEAGYKNVIWYRGGTNAWSEANLGSAVPERVVW